MSEAIGNSHSAVLHYVDLMPTEMVERRVQLKKLLERYPVAISVTEAANFLEMKEEGLRKSLLQGMCPFGFAYKNGERAAYKIPSDTFLSWFSAGSC